MNHLHSISEEVHDGRYSAFNVAYNNGFGLVRVQSRTQHEFNNEF